MFYDDGEIPMETEEEKRRRLLGMLQPVRSNIDPFAAATVPSQAGAVNNVVSNFLSQQMQPPPSPMGPPAPPPANDPMSIGASLPKMAWPPQPVASAPALSPQDSRYAAIMADPQGFLDNWTNRDREARYKFFTGLNPSTIGSGTPLTPVPSMTEEPWMANMMGPPAPGQRVSPWRNDGGVMINDGYTGPSQAMAAPGAGYTRQTANGFEPIAHPTDADYGTRLQMDPYTNPVLQDMVRRQTFQRSMQRDQLDNELVKAQIMYGPRNDAAEEKNLNAAIRTAGNISLPGSTREAMIKKMPGLDQETKDLMRLEALTTTMGPNKQPITIGPTKVVKGTDGKPKESVDFTEILSRMPEDIPQETIFKFLKENRGVTRDDIVRHLTGIYDESKDYSGPLGALGEKIGAPGSGDAKINLGKLTPQRKKEHDLIIKYLGRRG